MTDITCVFTLNGQTWNGAQLERLEYERVGLSVHPEHFMAIVEDGEITGIEPFGMYGTPTLVHVDVCPPEHTPDEIVDGHSLHLAMEFYEGLRYMEGKNQ